MSHKVFITIVSFIFEEDGIIQAGNAVIFL